MSDLLLRQLVWADYRAAVVLTVTLPLVLFVWSALRQEGAINRLLRIYWKISSLLAVTVLLMAGGQRIAFLTATVAHLLILLALWFWVDLNEELADMPLRRPLALTTRIWRWSLTFFALLGLLISGSALGCVMSADQPLLPSCTVWLEAPRRFSEGIGSVLGFLFGARWTSNSASLAGYVGLGAYGVGLLQWMMVRLPRYGRLAGDF
ncbi:MAG: DUF3177 family protein [Aphanocapsa feldmannii 277cV]|uniref:DUF3177 family protein n=2 Tax=Aphanocapsa feldmannii TaxID=192050 RepID=A0A524RN82_9CHRO|nr:MAG: DUF3177 family protein [Aphanocapsa feldmannii 288cV]TGG92253.1 MAG: DUF3177 family protein [Aphanocapsa feldmannii 277cV]TGH26149.1 MAG: DUF3177 family protein [Aphanocapsa feldmannii 277cI]